MVGIGIIGFGTVGSSVIKIINSHHDLIRHRVGDRVVIRKICDRDLSTPRPVKVNSKLLTSDINTVLNDPEIQIIVELIGGKDLAKNIIMDAIHRGKHIATANKAVLSHYWPEIFTAAQNQHTLVYFEASVAAGVPVIQSLNEGLAANRIHSITGILNGTTNYILTKMTQERLSFNVALAQAQKAGFAEANPKLDVEGYDTAQKLAILCSLAYGGWIKPQNIYREGINNLNLVDVKYACDQFGLITKLIGQSQQFNNHKISLQVRPNLIYQTHPFATVDNEYNAILIKGDAVDDVMFYGKGAGGMSAASAVVSDIIYLARHIVHNTAGKIPYVTYQVHKNFVTVPVTENRGCYYLRINVTDQPGVLAKIAGILGQNQVSIASVNQKERLNNQDRTGVPIIMLTHQTKEGDIRRAVTELKKLPVVRATPVFLPILE